MSPEIPTITVDDISDAPGLAEPSTSDDGRTPILLDVREADEWRAGHAPQAIHLPMSELSERTSELDHTARYHVICRSGNRSGRVVSWMVANGYHAVNVAGGMYAWAQAGRTVVTESGGTGVVV